MSSEKGLYIGAGVAMALLISFGGLFVPPIATTYFGSKFLDLNTRLSSSPFESTSTYNSSLTNITTHFQNEPTYRGTVGILTTCLTTLGLCVWTALHLNIPEPEPSEDVDTQIKTSVWERGWRKVVMTTTRFYWILVGILVPELIAFIAWKQFLSAEDFNKEMLEILGQEDESATSSNGNRRLNGSSTNECAGDPPITRNGIRRSRDVEAAIDSVQPNSTSSARRHKWTKVHSFYALMGGFALDPRGKSPFIPGSPYQMLGPEGVLLLAEAGHLPDISEQDIQDKSKTDGLGQILACFQAFWLIIQCIGRRKLGLFITTLELNTIGHVFCALVAFSLWWNKPFQIKEPTLIYGKESREICAYMWMTSSVSATVLGTYEQLPELESVSYCPGQTPLSAEKSVEASISSNKDELSLSAGQRLPGSDFVVSSGSKRFYESKYIAKRSEHRINQTDRVRGHERNLPKILHFQPLDTERWRLASAAMSNPAYKNLLPYTKSTRDLIVKRPYNLPKGWGELEDFSWRECAAFGSVALVYTVVHAFAWNSTFATEIERNMWRLAVIYLSAVFVIILAYGVYSVLRECLVGKEAASWEDDKGWHRFMIIVFFTSGVFLVGFGYTLGRVYLMIESLIGLRHLPPDAYLVPQWSQVMPHW